MPISFIASVTAGWSWSAGLAPGGDHAHAVPGPAAQESAAAIWLRPALWTQTDEASGTETVIGRS